MEVRLAEHWGMCFGVRDAIDLALHLSQRGPLTILGDLVHNPDVIERMRQAGAGQARRPDEVATAAVLLTAHGTAHRVKLQLRSEGHQVHDATCPLVRRVHLILRKLVAESRYPVVIGQANHVEVRGLVGDFEEYAVVLSKYEIECLDEPVARIGRLGIVAQTTQPLDLVLDIVNAVGARYPTADIRFVDTVCQPTKDRQEAMHRLAAESDVIVVVGGPESNNSRKLTELARRLGRPAYQVATAAELQPECFRGHRVVGLTAGTSTPDYVIAEVREWLERLDAGNRAPMVSV